MYSTNLLKILLLIFMAFALGEVIFTLQHYGKDIFKPRPGSCKIVEEKFCSQGQVVHLDNATFIGFKLTPSTPIFAPIDGQVSKAKINQPSEFQGYLVRLGNPNLANSFPQATFFFIGDLRFDNMLSVNVRKGDIVGYVENSGIKNLGKYNLITQTSTNTDILKELFPKTK